MLGTNRKQPKNSEEANDEMMLEASNDSDRTVTDQISNTMEIISKIIDANVQAESPEDQFFAIDGKMLDRRESYRYSKKSQN